MIDLQQLSQSLAKHCLRILGGSGRLFEIDGACWLFAAPDAFPALEHLEALINTHALAQGGLALDLSACRFEEQSGLLVYNTPEGPLGVEVTCLEGQIAVVLFCGAARPL